jgi:pyruvate/2-oxoacid:ferredoxin oxidoreductase alpha subunit
MGSIAAEATLAADLLRDEGISAGVVGIRSYRPFPLELPTVLRNARLIVVFEKCFSYGYEGGVASDLKASLYQTGVNAPVVDVIAGLGGRDVKTADLLGAVREALKSLDEGDRACRTVWLNCREEE